MPTREYYLNLRRLYEPKNIRLIFVAESPPISSKYFYDPKGNPSEPLFKELLWATLKKKYSTKAEGLGAFKMAGNLLVDATYQPVNHKLLSKRRIDICKGLPALIKDLRNLLHSNKGNIILVKANICRLLEGPLLAAGFKVINRGVIVPFPSTGHQVEFRRIIAPLLIKAARL
jgi:hypothetical protein